MTILSIDSGIERTGYAVFKDKKYVTSALIKTNKSDSTEIRLEEIYSKLSQVFKKYQPDVMVLEQLLFFRNQKTFIRVAQAQGIVMLLASQNKIKVEFLTPLQIKQIVTGYGQADKKSVQKMIKLTTNIDIKQDDEADAVACGLAYILIH
jgi:crossover junction endodeoxyribonuclease RuvC